MSNQITPSPLNQRAVVDQVLGTMANVSLLPEQPVDAASFFSQAPLASMLRYTSPADQVLILQCSPQLAFTLAANFFDRSLPTCAQDEDVTDTMTELINMVGGNLKALMPEETLIGIPWAQQHDKTLEKIDGQLSRLWLVTTSGPMCLTFANYASA